MRALINYGADLNKPDRSQGATPLFVACQNGKKSAVDLLLASGAEVNRPREGDGTSPLMMSAHNGHADIVDVLLRSGADPMQPNSTGLNALGCAAMQGHAKIVKLIYEHMKRVEDMSKIRQFVNAGDEVNGWTPLHLACMGGHVNVIKYLIYTVKVDIFKKDYENKSGLEHAWASGHQNIVSWLSSLEDQFQ
jgi:ankyrin repeat protein